MIRYYVRRIPDRKLNSTYNQIDFEELIDYNHDPVDSYISQLKLISDEDSVLIEDDVLLCKNFKKEIEEVISKYPNSIISFFDEPRIYYKTKYKRNLCWTQCIYYPKGISKIIANEMEKVHCKPYTYDIILSEVMNRLKLNYLSYRPTLVQHLDSNTYIQKNCPRNRFTLYFKDYMDDLKIDYNDLGKINNFRIKLDNLVRLNILNKEDI